MNGRAVVATAVYAVLLIPGAALADDTGTPEKNAEQKSSGPFGVKENALDATAAVESNVPGLSNIKFGGYLRPELVLTVRPGALPRDKYEYGIGTSRAGLLIGGEPVKGFHALVISHRMVGPLTMGQLTWL